MWKVELTYPLRGGANDEKRINGGTEMKHFKAVEWSDFVKRVGSDDRRKAMHERRGSRRKRYVETIALLQKGANGAAVEACYQPAAESVRVVKAAFATASLAAKPQETDGPIQLLFDSFSQPALAGTRSAAGPIRQLLYRADPYQIDLQIELQQDQNRFVITGQLVDLSHPEMVGRDLQVMLSDGREYVVHTVTNQFGEFRGEVENSGDLELSFLGRGGKPIVILLRGALDPLSAPEG